jgi:hypothetical protein
MTDRLFSLARLVAASLIAGVDRRRSLRDVHDALSARSLRQQILITGGVLLTLFGACLFAAQFGLVGLLVLFLAIVVLVN